MAGMLSREVDTVTSEVHNTAPETRLIPVIEESVTVGKRVVETGTVRVTKKVFDEPQTISIPLSHTEYVVDHVPINQYVDVAPASMRQEGETTIISVLREVLVVEKRLMLVEEIHLTRRHSEIVHEEEVVLRREEIVIERLPGTQAERAGA
jgi:uncharacterized protein (TIGR02271 family)